MPRKSRRKSRLTFAGLAAAATLGAVQFASGHDLADRFQAVTDPVVAAGVNRAVKADREAAPQATATARTIQLRIDSLVDTSVLVRIPEQKDASNLPPAPPAAKPGTAKLTIACEPPVSVLTDVAKLLQPGRCVT